MKNEEYEMSARLNHVVATAAFRFRHYQHCQNNDWPFVLEQAKRIFDEYIVTKEDFDINDYPKTGSDREGLIKYLCRLDYNWRPIVSAFRLKNPAASARLDTIFLDAEDHYKIWNENRKKLNEESNYYPDGRYHGD